MAIDFSQLKAGRKQSLTKLLDNVQKLSSKVEKDDRYWKLTVDKAGNGSAIIRFLPAAKGEESSFVRYWDHGFQGPGGWYLEKSRTTLGEADPLSELNSELWRSGLESDKDIARTQKRRLHFVSNILVVRDPAKPENEGKVFLFDYGKKIFDKLTDISTPDELDGTEGIDPFNFWEGANFRLRSQTVENYRNYDKSAFDNPTPVSEDDDEIEKIWNAQHSLAEVISPDKFKSYDELQARLNRVLGSVVRNTTIADDMVDGTMDDVLPERQKPKRDAPQQKAKAEPAEEDEEEYFRSLAGMGEE